MRKGIFENIPECFVLAFCVLMLSASISSASNMSVYREYPAFSKTGSVIQINITVENYGSSQVQATIDENVGNYAIIEPTPITPKATPGMIGFRGPYFEWNVSIEPNSNKTVYYKVNLTSPGEIILSPTEVTAGNEIIYAPLGTIKVYCNQNGVCEKALGEDIFTCPEDCPTGAADGICDLMKDGRCDPDCTLGADVDCIKEEEPIENETPPGGEIPPETPPKSLLETYWWIVPLAVASVIIVIVYIFLKKRQKPKETNEWQAAYENAPPANQENPNP